MLLHRYPTAAMKQREKNIYEITVSNDVIEPFTCATLRKFSYIIPDLSITNSICNVMKVNYYVEVGKSI